MTRAEDGISRWQSIFQVWFMPLWVAITAAIGGYIGVLRAINEVRAEVRVLQAEYRATMAAMERRLDLLESNLPDDATMQRDIAALRESIDRTARGWIERHEEVYHHRTGRRTE